MHATDNPELANDIISQVLAEPAIDEAEQQSSVEVLTPPDLLLSLPGGYISPSGELSTEAEIRELVGRDEEAISKVKTVGAAMTTILKRGIVRVGEAPADDTVLDNMLAGDRDFALLRIFAATFGNTITSEQICACGSQVTVTVDVTEDVEVHRLSDPTDRRFVVELQRGQALVELPTGHTQKALFAAGDKTFSELSTLLLANTVTEINGMPVLGPQQVLDLPVRDRRKIADEIAKRNPGPRLADVKKPCPDCGETLEVPVSLASLFQF